MLRYNLYLVALATAFQLAVMLVPDALVNVGTLPGVDGLVGLGVGVGELPPLLELGVCEVAETTLNGKLNL